MTVGRSSSDDILKTFKASKNCPFAGIYTHRGVNRAVFGLGVVYAPS